jgi:thiamine pyrophosphate-dependent acetolactate synthase large subunit-like protein
LSAAGEQVRGAIDEARDRAGEKKMARTVADQFAEGLATIGIKRIYGIAWDSLNGLTDSLRHQGKIECIRVRREELAAFAARAEGFTP